MQAIARLSEIPDEGLKFSYKEGPFDEEGILVRLPDGSVRAYKNECRHLPMPLDDQDPGELWDPSETFLVCASHGARYQPDDGLCVSGPCEGSHLRSLPLELHDDEVYLVVEKLGSFFDV
jgi:nitrite reductase/ring-hydroxylating ferredoxin subunit